MANIRKIAFAARDGHAGSMELNKATKYISEKNIQIIGPFPEIEAVQLLIQTEFELKMGGKLDGKILDIWRKDCPKAIDLAYKWFKEDKLTAFSNRREPFFVVYNCIMEELF